MDFRIIINHQSFATHQREYFHFPYKPVKRSDISKGLKMGLRMSIVLYVFLVWSVHNEWGNYLWRIDTSGIKFPHEQLRTTWTSVISYGRALSIKASFTTLITDLLYGIHFWKFTVHKMSCHCLPAIVVVIPSLEMYCILVDWHACPGPRHTLRPQN